MTQRIFVDGASGTVGMALMPHLEDLSLERPLKITCLRDESERRDVNRRRSCMDKADLVVLCLPDEAAVTAVELVREANPQARILDASAAHRCRADWTYGLPEIIGEDAIGAAQYVANPGCFATGCILLARPIARLLRTPWLPFQGFTGYSAGGKEAAISIDQPWLAQLGVSHRHLPEIERYGDLVPVLTTMVGSWFQGMLVQATVLLEAEQVLEAYQTAYAGAEGIEVLTPRKGQRRFMAKCNNGTNRVSIMVTGHANGGTTVAAAYDNLGKGSAGAAAANLRLMLQNMDMDASNGL